VTKAAASGGAGGTQDPAPRGPAPRGPFALPAQTRAVVNAAVALVQADASVAGLELAAARRALLRGAVMAALALALLLAGAGAAVAAVILGLMALGMSPGLAAVSTALLFVACAAVTVVFALRQWSAQRLVPVQTLEALRRFPETLSYPENLAQKEASHA